MESSINNCLRLLVKVEKVQEQLYSERSITDIEGDEEDKRNKEELTEKNNGA